MRKIQTGMYRIDRMKEERETSPCSLYLSILSILYIPVNFFSQSELLTESA